MSPLNPLISVIGATGTGKSKLAVDLAVAFNGEIINGDAMQLYKGLDVITNKIPPEDRHGIPHHLIGDVDIDDSVLIGQWQERALKIIDDIRARGKLPIVVGGTHYYIQSLLFDNCLVQSFAPCDPCPDSFSSPVTILNAPTPVILEELRRVDPAMASRWHPNNRRKIRRSLEIYLNTNRTASEIYAAQRSISEHAIKPRYKNLVFWLYSEPNILQERLDMRVHDMIEQGLFSEVEQMYSHYKAKTDNNQDVNMTTGIWQCIGWKEFLPFLILKDTSPDPTRDSEEAIGQHHTDLQVLKRNGLEKMKTRTRQYARSQIKWIKFKLLSTLLGAQGSELPGGGLYVLDTSDMTQWDASVLTIAKSLTGELLSPKGPYPDLPVPSTISDVAKAVLEDFHPEKVAERQTWISQTCEICDIVVFGPEAWKNHLTGRRHRRKIKKSKSGPNSVS